MTGTLKDGVLTVSYGDISYVFAKEGVEVPAENTTPETPVAPETPETPAVPEEPSAPEEAPESAPAQGEFFTTPTSWNGWILNR